MTVLNLIPKKKKPKRYKPTRYEYVFQHTKGKKLVYYFRGTVNGQFIGRSLQTDLISKAKDRADEIRKDPTETRKTLKQTFDEAFDVVLRLKSAESRETFEQPRYVINNHLRPWFKENCPYLRAPCARYPHGFLKQSKSVWADYKKEASKRKIPSYIERIKDENERQERIKAFLQKNITPRKLGHDLRFLVETLQRAFDAGEINKRFREKDFSLLEAHEEVGQYITDKDVKSILDGLKAFSTPYLQVLLAVTTGMRKAEILKLRKVEVNFEKREIDLDAGRLKTRKMRGCPIPIPDDVFPLLKEAYEKSNGNYIFPSIYRNKPGRPIDYNSPQVDNKHYWDKIRDDTGIDVRFHDLRHTAITNMIKSGIPDTMIQKICGVTKEVMQRIYAHLDQEIKNKFQKVMVGKFT